MRDHLWVLRLGIIGGYVLILAAFFAAMLWLVSPAIEYVEKHGLETVTEDLWCGQEGCKGDELENDHEG